MIKVLIADKLSYEAEKVFVSNNIKVDKKIGLSESEIATISKNYQGIAIRSNTQITSNIISKADKLKVIGRAGIGIDNIDIEAATKNGIVVMNTPYGNSITTAEHTIALLMSMARNIPQASASTHLGKWEKSKFMGVEIFGKTLGIIGCGNIGSLVAERASSLKMKIIIYDPFISEEQATEKGVVRVDLNTLFSSSDFITLHTPLTEKTQGIINKESLEICKKGVRLINCARGGLIVEEDLKTFINSGHVAGAAIDVFSTEPSYKNILFGLDNVIATPHLGASTNEAQENVSIQIAQQMSDYLINGAIVNALNMSSITMEDASKLKPYLDLANNLGKLCGQITESSIAKIKIYFMGYAAKINTKPIVGNLLAGIFSTRMEAVNIINSEIIAKQRNIEIITSFQETGGDYLTEIRLEVKTENRTVIFSGSLFSDTPRIIEIMGMKIESELTTNMLLISNTDKPGFIGALGTALGKENINIGTFNLGRDNAGEAVALISIDQKIPDEIVKKLNNLPNVKFVKRLSF